MKKDAEKALATFAAVRRSFIFEEKDSEFGREWEEKLFEKVNQTGNEGEDEEEGGGGGKPKRAGDHRKILPERRLGRARVCRANVRRRNRGAQESIESVVIER